MPYCSTSFPGEENIPKAKVSAVEQMKLPVRTARTDGQFVGSRQMKRDKENVLVYTVLEIA